MPLLGAARILDGPLSLPQILTSKPIECNVVRLATTNSGTASSELLDRSLQKVDKTHFLDWTLSHSPSASHHSPPISQINMSLQVPHREKAGAVSKDTKAVILVSLL
jgi:hypothetical protein